MLFREPGRWRFVEDKVQDLDVPESVGAVLMRRLERLSGPAREMAHWLSLFRSEVSRLLLFSLIPQGDSVAGMRSGNWATGRWCAQGSGDPRRP